MTEQERIPFHRPMQLDDDEKAAAMRKIIDCLTSGMLTNKENVREIESTIADHYDVRYAIATSSASQGLVIALQVMLRVYPTVYNVSTPAFAWYSTQYAVASTDRACHFIDIDPETWTMIPDEDYNITMPVHTFGNVCEIEGDYVIYDGAHALGSRIKDFGDATVMSLAPTKIITSIEGGIVLTDDPRLAIVIEAVRDKVSRMSEVHAIFGNIYLEHVDEVMKWKKQVFDYYSKNLKGTFQKTAKSTNHNTIGMLTDLKIPDTIEVKKYYEPLKPGLKNTDEVFRRIVCLPSYYGCPYHEIVNIINCFNAGE